MAAILLALAGSWPAAVSYVFYLVGRAEDRDQAATAKPPPAPPEPTPDEHPERNGHLRASGAGRHAAAPSPVTVRVTRRWRDGVVGSARVWTDSKQGVAQHDPENRWGTELPPPSDPDPEGAKNVQELMGGRFGEMSTLMNYTIPVVQLPQPPGRGPFYDLIANIAAEEYGHIELVAATINSMLTGASPVDDGRALEAALEDLKDRHVNPHHFLAGGQGALPPGLARAVDRRLRVLVGRPGRGPDAQLLPRDRRAQQQAEGLRDGAAPAARASPATCSCAAACISSPTRARSRS